MFGHYQLQVATNSSFTALVLDRNITGITNSVYPVPGETGVPDSFELTPNTEYYWRVRAFNTEGRYGAWSTARTFREAMVKPVLVSPDNSYKPDNLRPIFDWNVVEGADTYTIQVSRYADMSYPSINKVTADTEYLPTSDILKNRTLFWRVRANGANGPSPWSELRNIESPNPPVRPALLLPANTSLQVVTNAGNLTPPVRLDWSNSAIPAGTELAKYQLQVATNNQFTAPVIQQEIVPELGITPSEFTIPEDALLTNTRYYWRVRALTLPINTAAGLISAISAYQW